MACFDKVFRIVGQYENKIKAAIVLVPSRHEVVLVPKTYVSLSCVSVCHLSFVISCLRGVLIPLCVEAFLGYPRRGPGSLLW